MFRNFSHNKIRYESGQVFPFLIAIICIVIVMAMITVNLGQIALYRTDVSNAADAGALAGASVISGQLLSYGLTSDFMCGQNLIKCAAIVTAFLVAKLGTAIPIAIGILTTMLVSNMTAMLKAFTDSQMAWTNARKTAVQYAFSNIGVDEPRPTYEEFLDCVLGSCGDGRSEAPTAANYDEYIKLESQRALDHARNGFAKFMDNSKNGWWIDSLFGSVETDPGAPVPTPLVINGYGWGKNGLGQPINSFEHGGQPATCAPNRCWRDDRYDNFVEVQVRSRLLYAFELVDLGTPQQILAWAVFGYVFYTGYPFWLAIFSWTGPLAPLLAAIMATVEAAIARQLILAIAFGLKFPDDDEYIEGSPVEVRVFRYRESDNVGLWNFRYAGSRYAPIQALSRAHAFRESGDETIEPTFIQGTAFWPIVLGIILGGVLVGGALTFIINKISPLWDTSLHLFETRVYETQ